MVGEIDRAPLTERRGCHNRESVGCGQHLDVVAQQHRAAHRGDSVHGGALKHRVIGCDLKGAPIEHVAISAVVIDAENGSKLQPVEPVGRRGNRGGLLHAEQAAAVRHELRNSGHEFRIEPGVAPRPGTPRRACVQDDVDIGGDAVGSHISEGEEGDLKWKAGQRLDHMQQREFGVLVQVSGTGPGTQRSPGRQHAHAHRRDVRSSGVVQRGDEAVLVRDIRDVVLELRERLDQREVTAQADSIDLGAQQGAAHDRPVGAGIGGRIAAGGEGGLALQVDREQVRVQPQLVNGHVNACVEAGFESGEHSLDQTVESELGEPRRVRLEADPGVVVEDVGLLAVTVHDVHALLAEIEHEVDHGVHPLAVDRRGRVVRGGVAARVDEVFRGDRYPAAFVELTQRDRVDREVVGAPVGVHVRQARVVSPEPGEVIEQRGEADHGGVRVVHAPLLKPGQHVGGHLRVARLHSHQARLVTPVIGEVVVHRDLFPQPHGQEVHRVGVRGHRALDHHGAALKAPLLRRDLEAGGAVEDLPELHAVPVVHHELIGGEAVQERDGDLLPRRHHRLAHEEVLLQQPRVVHGPLPVFADQAERGVDAMPGIEDLARERGAIRVADNVRTPVLRHREREVFVAGFARQGESTRQRCHGHVLCRLNRFTS